MKTPTSTLTSAPVGALLTRLFADADSTDQAASVLHAQMSDDERRALMSSKTEYRSLYGQAKECYLAVSRETGALLYMLARAARAHSIVEFGTSFGLSTIHLAAALKDNGGGRLITTEFEPAKVAQARHNIHDAGLASYVEIREGDALETLARDLPAAIDLVLLDGAKGLYPEILALLEPRLKAGALVVADDAEYSPDYLARVRSSDSGYLSVTIRDGVELSIRLA